MADASLTTELARAGAAGRGDHIDTSTGATEGVASPHSSQTHVTSQGNGRVAVNCTPLAANIVSPVNDNVSPVASGIDSVSPVSPIPPVGSVNEPAPAMVSNKRIRLLYLFSGPYERVDGFKAHAVDVGSKLGLEIDVVQFDICEGESGNLADDMVWRGVKTRIESGAFDAALTSPPCSTFGCRRYDSTGLDPLRTVAGPDRYGMKNLRPNDKEKVRLGNLLSARAAWVFSWFIEHRRPIINEQPGMRDGRPHMYRLDEWTKSLETTGVTDTVVCQCELGSLHTKQTSLLGFMTCLDSYPKHCTHTAKWWREVLFGAPLPHASLKKMMYVWVIHAPVYKHDKNHIIYCIYIYIYTCTYISVRACVRVV